MLPQQQPPPSPGLQLHLLDSWTLFRAENILVKGKRQRSRSGAFRRSESTNRKGDLSQEPVLHVPAVQRAGFPELHSACGPWALTLLCHTWRLHFIEEETGAQSVRGFVEGLRASEGSSGWETRLLGHRSLFPVRLVKPSPSWCGGSATVPEHASAGRCQWGQSSEAQEETKELKKSLTVVLDHI